MPSRIIKESIHESESVNMMSDFEFRLWVNLITYVDDFGRGDARIAVIKGKCFPLMENLKSNTVKNALFALEKNGSITLYEVDGKPYFYFPNWQEHQNVRNKHSKYPEPPKTDENADFPHLQAIASNCNQLQSIDSNCPRNPIQSESKTESESESIICTELPERHSAQEPQSEQPVFKLILNDGSAYGVTQSDLDKYSTLYPAVNVCQEMRGMIGWLDANPSRRKTKSGIRRFINSWLSRSQNEGGAHGRTDKPAHAAESGYTPVGDRETVL